MNKNLKKLISTVAALAITATSAFTAFAANFSDVADTADYKVAVDNLVALGIVNGYEDGTFGPEKEITRAEASKMIVGTMGPAMMDAAEASKGSSNFTDVAGDHWASGFIAQGVSKGYINGMGDGTFAPNANVTYAQVVKMLVCVLGYAEDAEANGGWPNGYINQGTTLEVTDGVSVASADTPVNRGQVAMLINNALNVPIKGIEGYEQGFKMVDGQLVPTPVPVTEVYNGKGDSGKYETLLTTYFDAYTVRGRIEDTTTKGEGYVKFKIEYSENFDDEAVEVKGRDSVGAFSEGEVYYPAGLDVDALLCAYSDAIIMENEDGEWELVSIAPYGKNEVVTVSSELYVKDTFEMGDGDDEEGFVQFYKSATSSKKDDYELDPAAVVYVNGIEIKSDAEKTATDYLADPTAEFKFVNTPKAGSKSVDSLYDYIMITSYITAVVDEVFVEEDKAEIYLKDSTAAISSIKLDLEAAAEGEVEYNFEDKDGNEVSYEDLVAYDVLTIYASTTTPADLEKKDANVSYINVIVTKDVVEGKLSSANAEDKTYTIGGEDYKFAGEYVTKLADSIGDDFTIYLNAFGKIATYEKTASVVNYGIINRVWTNNNGENVVRLINTDGQVVTYEFNKSADFDTWVGTYNDLADPDGNNSNDDAKAFVDNFTKLIVTYKVNSSEKIFNIEAAATLEDGFAITEANEEYDEKNQKVGKAKMSDKTKIVDLSEALNTWYGSVSGKVAAGSVDSFVDGEGYQVIYGGTQFTDKTYPFVIVVDGVSKVGTASRFAVVKSFGNSVNEADGVSYTSATVLEGKEEKVIYFDGSATVKKGDVIMYGVNGEGLVEDENLYVLYNGNTDIGLDDVAAVNKANGSVYYTADTATFSPWAKEKYGDDDKQAMFGYGVLVDKSATDITVGTVVDGTTTELEDIDVATDVNVYVFDQGIGKGDKMSAGSMASLAATKLPTQFAEDDVYQWSEKYEEVKTVFFKTFEGEITDIIVVIPAE